MHVVVYGVGAVGGVVGARLQQHGHRITCIARGAQLNALRDDGLRFATPDIHLTVRPTVVDHPRHIDLATVDVVLLTMKSQDTAQALSVLSASAPADLPVVCVQNGVHNEHTAQRYFERVYAVTVMCPCAYLEPGHVIAYSTPTTGILDIGRYPAGADETCHAIATALGAATFVSEARADIMRWKYRKLIVNVGNAVEALCGPAARRGAAAALATDEAERVLGAAGVAVVSRQADADRRGDIMRRAPVDGSHRPGGSMWQSIARGAGSIEVAYLNGEVVRIAHANGTSAPVNETLQRLCTQMIADGRPAGSMSEDELLTHLGASAPDA